MSRLAKQHPEYFHPVEQYPINQPRKESRKMAIMVSGGSNFAPAPAGTHQAVCVDVIDMGMQDTQFGRKHMVRIVWQIAEDMTDGRPFIVSKRYSATLNEKATLRHDLEAWRGRPFTGQELAGFDVESIIGANCLIGVVHKAGEKGTFANVGSIMPLAKGMAPISGRDYTRQKDREEPVPASVAFAHRPTVGPAPEAIDDSGIPF